MVDQKTYLLDRVHQCNSPNLVFRNGNDRAWVAGLCIQHGLNRLDALERRKHTIIGTSSSSALYVPESSNPSVEF